MIEKPNPELVCKIDANNMMVIKMTTVLNMHLLIMSPKFLKKPNLFYQKGKFQLTSIPIIPHII